MQPNIYVSSSDFDSLFNIRDSVMDKKMNDCKTIFRITLIILDVYIKPESSPINQDN